MQPQATDNPTSQTRTNTLLDISDLAEEPSDDQPTEQTSSEPSHFAVSEPQSGTPDLEPPLLIYPETALDGDYIGDLAYALTKGTAVPMCMARANIKTIVSAMVDGRVGFPGHEDLPMRHYSMQIAPTRSGKGESWKRTGALPNGVLNPLIAEKAVLVDGGTFGSGEFMIAKLSRHDRKIIIARFDEMKVLFEKAQTKCSILESTFLSLYETTQASSGSHTNGEHAFENVRFNFTGDFTREGFEKIFAGRGAASSGFLARCTLTYSNRKIHEGDWSSLDPIAVHKAVKPIQAAITHIESGTGKGVWMPSENPDAKARRVEFVNALTKSDDPHCAELQAHFKRDLLLRALFSDNQITTDKVDRAIAWTEHQLVLRKELWPEDAGSPVERMERRIRATLIKQGELTDRDLMKACHTEREGSGGSAIYVYARNAMLAAKVIEKSSLTKRGSQKYRLTEE
jgi:hypothetical protein